jgi:tight adherence protein C
VLFYLRDRFREKDAIDYRNRQLLLDYPEIVSKLMVFIGAGMTIRLAWENIVNDYETGKTGKRFAYEEMSRSLSQLKTGVNEGKVYRDFGRSCGLKQYMKLSGILEQNRKTGIADIRNILHEETSLAWEERKTIARRMGEEASTKLIAPLMIMLLIVMVMIIVPAMMSFA